MKKLKYLPLLCALVSSPLLADAKWGLGIGAVTEDEGYIDLGTETNAIPVIYYETENFYILGPRIGYEFSSLSDFEFTLLGQYRFDGYEVEDGDIFAGMEERAGSFDIGLEIEYETDFGDFAFEFLNDVTSEHEGYEASFTYSLPFILESGVVSPYISVINQSDDLVNHYYGVRTNEVTNTRPFYEGTSTTNYEIGVQSDWMFGDHHMVVANLAYRSLGSEIKDSPLIDASSSLQLIMGYVYVF